MFLDSKASAVVFIDRVPLNFLRTLDHHCHQRVGSMLIEVRVQVLQEVAGPSKIFRPGCNWFWGKRYVSAEHFWSGIQGDSVQPTKHYVVPGTCGIDTKHRFLDCVHLKKLHTFIQCLQWHCWASQTTTSGQPAQCIQKHSLHHASRSSWGGSNVWMQSAGNACLYSSNSRRDKRSVQRLSLPEMWWTWTSIPEWSTMLATPRSGPLCRVSETPRELKAATELRLSVNRRIQRGGCPNNATWWIADKITISLRNKMSILISGGHGWSQ